MIIRSRLGAALLTSLLATGAQAAEPDALGREALGVFVDYLRVDTTNPPGNETRGAEYLAHVLAREGIPSRIIDWKPGRGNLVARLDPLGPATEKPLCLLSHIDVVDAEPEKWRAGLGPRSGAVDERGAMVGRGALDMKGMGALEAMTLVLLKRHAVPLKRSVILLAVADEEVASGGVKFLAEKHWKEIDCGVVLNEGGLGIRDPIFKGQTVWGISVADKGALWVKMTAHGEAGHGSVPVPGRAPERLMKAVAALQAHEPKVTVHPSLYTMLAQMGRQHGGAAGFVLARPALVDTFVLGSLKNEPRPRAMITDTIHVTGFSGGTEPNVVPSEVTATLDCRLLPKTTPKRFLLELERIVNDPKVTFEVIFAEQGNESPWEGEPFYDALVRHVLDGRPDAAAGPVLSPGYTDNITLRPLGVRAYGLVPFEVSQEEAEGFHGKDERVPLGSVTAGIRALYRAVVDASARAPGAAEGAPRRP